VVPLDNLTEPVSEILSRKPDRRIGGPSPPAPDKEWLLVKGFKFAWIFEIFGENQLSGLPLCYKRGAEVHPCEVFKLVTGFHNLAYTDAVGETQTHMIVVRKPSFRVCVRLANYFTERVIGAPSVDELKQFLLGEAPVRDCQKQVLVSIFRMTVRHRHSWFYI